MISFLDSRWKASPDGEGSWEYRRGALFMARKVLVEDGPSSGRFCRELRMGGSMRCGFAPWSGQWRRVI